jgi:prepilin-type N-terminal cleavage/methylation domain-containing protein
MGSKGFSLLELMVGIALITIVTAVALPNLVGQTLGSKLRGASDNLRGDFQLARARAIRDSVPVALLFTATEYRLFTDEGATPGSLDAGETLIRSRKFSPGVGCDLSATTFTDHVVRFDTRGRVEESGIVVLNTNNGKQLQLTVSLLGQITAQ